MDGNGQSAMRLLGGPQHEIWTKLLTKVCLQILCVVYSVCLKWQWMMWMWFCVSHMHSGRQVKVAASQLSCGDVGECSGVR